MSTGPARRLRTSLLDRVLDRPVPGTGGAGRRALYESLCRDIEALLNSRRPWASLPARHAALRKSILAFGLSDFTAGAFNHVARREALCRDIAAAIKVFEPRLVKDTVKVTLADRRDDTDPVLRIRISGMLHLEELDEPVSFDTRLDTTTADMTVQPDRRAG